MKFEGFQKSLHPFLFTQSIPKIHRTFSFASSLWMLRCAIRQKFLLETEKTLAREKKMTDQNEVTKDTLRHILTGLKQQEGMERLRTSESIEKIKNFTVEAEACDPFITPMDKKSNPWNEKQGKCIVN